MKRAYGFVRVKTEKNSTPPLETQQALIKDYCNENNLELVEIFVDTSRFPNVFDQMLARCRKKDSIQEIVVTSWDRISNDEMEFCLIQGLLAQKRINLITLEDL